MRKSGSGFRRCSLTTVDLFLLSPVCPFRRMVRRRSTMSRSLFAIGAAAVLLLPQAAGAQAGVPSSALPDLSKVLKTGEVLIVVDDKGERTTGRLAELSSSTLTLQVPGKAARGFLVSDTPVLPEQRRFDLGAVTRIDRKDSVKEGALLGLAVGLGIAYAILHPCYQSDYQGEHCLQGVLAVAALAAGPAIGAVIDSSIKASIYRAPSGRLTASLDLSPRLRRKGGVMSVNLAF